MASNAPVIVLLGAGLNTGLATAKKFHSQGWKVVCVARTEKAEFNPYQSLFIQADFTDPKTLQAAFEKFEAEVGIANVVVYNAYAYSFGQNPEDLFDGVSVEEYGRDLQINSTSNYAAIKLAIAGFKRLASDAPKVYFYTGNMCSGLIVPENITLGPGKNASLWTVENAAAAYGSLAKWYFADERDVEGNSTMHKINGEAHAEVFWDLAHDKTQHEINYTFVKGKGYTKFNNEVSRPVAKVADLLQIAEKNSKA